MCKEENKTEENAFQKVTEDKSDEKNPRTVSDREVERENNILNPDENTRDRG